MPKNETVGKLKTRIMRVEDRMNVRQYGEPSCSPYPFCVPIEEVVKAILDHLGKKVLWQPDKYILVKKE